MGDRRRTSPTGTIRVTVSDAAAAAREILPIVVAAGVVLVSFEQARPTLEDVFLELVGPASSDELDGRGFVRPRAAGPSMTGFRVLLRKELLEQWRTLRLPVVAARLPARRPQLAAPRPVHAGAPRGASAGRQLQIVLPTPTTADAVDQLIKNVSQFGILVAVLLAMGSVATEKERGTAGADPDEAGRPRRVPRREARGDRRARWRSRSALAAAAAWFYTLVLFEALPVAGFAASAVLQWLAIMAFAAITFLASTLTRSALAAAGIGVVAFIVIGVLSAFPAIAPYLPVGLGAPARALALGLPVDDALRPIVATIALDRRLPSRLAWLSFRRQEL